MCWTLSIGSLDKEPSRPCSPCDRESERVHRCSQGVIKCVCRSRTKQPRCFCMFVCVCVCVCEAGSLQYPVTPPLHALCVYSTMLFCLQGWRVIERTRKSQRKTLKLACIFKRGERNKERRINNWQCIFFIKLCGWIYLKTECKQGGIMTMEESQ